MMRKPKITYFINYEFDGSTDFLHLFSSGGARNSSNISEALIGTHYHVPKAAVPLA